MDTKIGFKNTMYVYSLETVEKPKSLKIRIPEVFLDSPDSPSSVKLQKGSTNMFLNATPPVISSYVTSYNYIDLPLTFDIDKVYKSDRFLAVFNNNTPLNGLIIARC